MNGNTKLNVFFSDGYLKVFSHMRVAPFIQSAVYVYPPLFTLFCHSHVAVKVYHHFQDHDKYSYPGTPLKTFHSAGVSGLDPSYYTMCGATAPWLHDVLCVDQGKYEYWHILTHWGRDKMDIISQTTFSGAFSLIKRFEFRLEFHWNFFLRFQLIHCALVTPCGGRDLGQHWFR